MAPIRDGHSVIRPTGEQYRCSSFAQAAQLGVQTGVAEVVEIEDLVAGRVCDRGVDADAPRSSSRCPPGTVALSWLRRTTPRSMFATCSQVMAAAGGHIGAPQSTSVGG